MQQRPLQRGEPQVPLDRWTKGDKVSARHLNQPVIVLDEMRRGVAPGRSIYPLAKGVAASGGIVPVLLRRYLDDDPNSRFVYVQSVVEAETGGEWNGGFVADGDQYLVRVWPTMVAGDFSPFVWPTGEPDERTTLLPLIQWAGSWWLLQWFKSGIDETSGPEQTMECT